MTVTSEADGRRIDWLRTLPFIGVHLACLWAFYTGVSPVAVAAALGFYLLRMFFITAFYHRYFSHRAFRTSRPAQFLMAVLGCTAGQRGPLWWAGHHREHHVTADTEADPHSPAHRGMWFSHTLWFLTRNSFALKEQRVKDWLKFPELVLLERVDWIPFVLFGAGCYGLGAWLSASAPQLATDGPQLLVWGFFISTVLLYHATYSINSLAHRFGSRRFNTPDDSRNNLWLALITLGEGWHNNHHRFPAAARQGFLRREVDISYLLLRLLSLTGSIWDLRQVPDHVLSSAKHPEAPPS
ncbi:MAG: acyl-CoA desaturase [Gammaproteobacteria bacterium]|nr:acyl-CoA desaturase [Gammaproteobacteria bacterium]MDH3410884.1 acyl-CoA desaturase [Gammaproteobacteria bacterium]